MVMKHGLLYRGKSFFKDLFYCTTDIRKKRKLKIFNFSPLKKVKAIIHSVFIQFLFLLVSIGYFTFYYNRLYLMFH